MRARRFNDGLIVRHLQTGRCGTVVRWWHPYDQYRIEWLDGTQTNVWGTDLEAVKCLTHPNSCTRR